MFALLLCIPLKYVLSQPQTQTTRQQEQSKEQLTLKTLNLSKQEMANIRYSDLFSEVVFVPLEVAKNSLIGDVYTVRIYNDTLYVFDKFDAKSLFLYTLEGKFIRRIGTQGKGPGEYTNPYDFRVNMTNRTISFLDSYTSRIIIYSIEGKHIKDIKLDFLEPATFFAESSNHFYLASVTKGFSDVQYSLKSFTSNGKQSKRWFEFNSFNKEFNMQITPFKSCFFNYQNEVRFFGYFNDTIFSIRNNQVYPFMAIRTDEPLTISDLQDAASKQKTNDPQVFFEIRKSNKYFGIAAYLENDKWIAFTISKGFYIYNILYDKRKNTFSQAALKDDMTGIMKSDFDFCNDSWFAKYLVYPNTVDDLRLNAKDKSFNQFWRNSEVLNKRNIDQNPVIILYKVKE